jgi:hypothetical protein
MSTDRDWDNWNEKFIEKIIRIVNSEQLKCQRINPPAGSRRRRSQFVLSRPIKEVLAESQSYVSSQNKIKRSV